MPPGTILAHSLAAGGLRLKKGRLLGAADVAALCRGRRRRGDRRPARGRRPGEDAAAERPSRAALATGEALGLTVSAPFTGRVNLFAEADGLLRVDAATVDALNRVDPALTLATLPDWSRVEPRQMVATVKVIPYAAPARGSRRRPRRSAGGTVLALQPFRPQTASLILTRTPGLKESLIAKGAEAVGARLEALG